MFAQFDADSSGAIDADELSLALASNNLTVAAVWGAEGVEDMLSRFDKDGSDTFNLEEMLEAAISAQTTTGGGLTEALPEASQ